MIRAALLVLASLFFVSCADEPEFPVVHLQLGNAIECAQIDSVRWFDQAAMTGYLDSLNNPETARVLAPDGRVERFVRAQFFVTSRLGAHFRTTRVRCRGLIEGITDSLTGSAWFMEDSLVGITLSTMIEKKAKWQVSEPFERMSPGELYSANAGLWEAVSLWEPLSEYEERTLYLVDLTSPWIAVVDEYDSEYDTTRILTVTLLRDVDYLDLLDPADVRELDTLVVDAYRFLGATRLGVVEESRCVDGHMSLGRSTYDEDDPELGALYWAIPPPPIEPSGHTSQNDSTCSEVPRVRVIGIAGSERIGGQLSHSPYGIPFYLLSAEVISGDFPD